MKKSQGKLERYLTRFTKKELVTYVVLTKHLQGSKFFSINSYNKYEIAYKNLAFTDRIRIIARCIRFFIFEV